MRPICNISEEKYTSLFSSLEQLHKIDICSSILQKNKFRTDNFASCFNYSLQTNNVIAAISLENCISLKLRVLMQIKF